MILDLVFSLGLLGGLLGMGGVAVVLSKDALLLRKVSHTLTDVLCALLIATIVLHMLSSTDMGVSSIKIFSIFDWLANENSPTIDFSMLLSNIDFSVLLSDPLFQLFGVAVLDLLSKLYVDILLGFKSERKVDKPNE